MFCSRNALITHVGENYSDYTCATVTHSHNMYLAHHLCMVHYMLHQIAVHTTGVSTQAYTRIEVWEICQVYQFGYEL